MAPDARSQIPHAGHGNHSSGSLASSWRCRTRSLSFSKRSCAESVSLEGFSCSLSNHLATLSSSATSSRRHSAWTIAALFLWRPASAGVAAACGRLCLQQRMPCTPSGDPGAAVQLGCGGRKVCCCGSSAAPLGIRHCARSLRFWAGRAPDESLTTIVFIEPVVLQVTCTVWLFAACVT